MQTSSSTAVALLAALAGFLATFPLSAQTTVTLEDSPLYYTDLHTTTVADPLTFTIADGFATQSGVIDGDGSLTKTGAGAISLAGANTYTGGTVIDAGILAIDNDGEFTFGTLGSGTTTIHGDTGSGFAGTLQFLTNSSAGGDMFTLTGSTIDGGTGGTVEFYGASTAGSGTFTVEGATVSGTAGGFVIFLGTSTAGSATLIANGSANAGAGGSIFFVENSLGGTAAVKVYGNGYLDIGFHNAGLTIGSLEGTGQVFLGANNLTIGSDNTTTTFFGTVQDGGAAGGVLGSLTKIGTGTLTLTGTNTYEGGTTITGWGAIEFSSGDNLGTGNITLDGGGLKWAAGNTTDISSRLNPISYNGSILDTNGNNVSFASVLSGDTLYNYSQLIKTGAGTLTLAAGSTVVDFEVIGGTLVFGTGTYQDRYLYVGNGNWATSVNGAGPSAAILSGAGTSFSSQETSVGSYTAFSASLTISDGASFASTGGTTLGDHSTAESTLTVTGTGSTFTGDISLAVGNTSSGRSSFLVSDGASATFQSTVVIGRRSTGESLLTVSGAGSTFTADSPLSIGVGEFPGSAPFVTGASSMIVSSGASASAVATQIGRFGATGANSLTLTGTGSTFTTGSLTLAESALDNGTVNLGSASTDAATAAGILDTATVTGGLGTAVLQFNTTGTNLAPTYFTRDGTSTGTGVNTAGGLAIVNTAGTTVLSGTLAHTGATTVNGGTLRVNSSLVSSAVTVNAGATLGGSGTLGGLATFASGAHLAPGNSPGTLTFTGGLTLSGGSILDFQLGTTSDLILVTGGTLTGPSSGTITVNLTDSGGFTAGTYNFIDATGATLSSIGATTFELGTTIAGYDYTFVQSGNLFQVIAVAAAIPEPSTYAVIASFACLAVAVWRRRRS